MTHFSNFLILMPIGLFLAGGRGVCLLGSSQQGRLASEGACPLGASASGSSFIGRRMLLAHGRRMRLAGPQSVLANSPQRWPIGGWTASERFCSKGARTMGEIPKKSKTKFYLLKNNNNNNNNNNKTNHCFSSSSSFISTRARHSRG
jgi:hypothetical protein